MIGYAVILACLAFAVGGGLVWFRAWGERRRVAGREGLNEAQIACRPALFSKAERDFASRAAKLAAKRFRHEQQDAEGLYEDADEDEDTLVRKVVKS